MAPLFFQDYGGGGGGVDSSVPPSPELKKFADEWLADRPPFWERMGVKEMLLTGLWYACGICFSLTMIALLIFLAAIGLENRTLMWVSGTVLAVGIGFFVVNATRDFVRARARAGKGWWA